MITRNSCFQVERVLSLTCETDRCSTRLPQLVFVVSALLESAHARAQIRLELLGEQFEFGGRFFDSEKRAKGSSDQFLATSVDA